MLTERTKKVTDYTDYRAYLRDYIALRKSEGIHLSNRYFAQKLGINSSSWLTSVLRGRKGLSKETANRMSQILGHNRNETRYFENLVFFNQAKKLEDRNRYFNELTMIRRSARTSVLQEDQFEYYRTWYHSVIRSLVMMKHIDPNDYEQLASALSPRITEAQARESVALLERLGLIKRREDGRFEQNAYAITTPERHRSLAIQNFQLETMRLGIEALDRYPKEQRDISTITVGITKDGFDQIRQAAAEFRDKVVAIANGNGANDRVCQLNIQFFPLSHIEGSES